MAGGECRLDFFDLLPPEVVLAIALNLNLDVIACCLLVSKRWCRLLSGLEPYWIQACTAFGLSDTVLKSYITRYKNTKSILFAARKHRQFIVDSPQTCTTLTEGYPYNVHYVCHYARESTIVGTIYRDFRPCEIVLKAVNHASITRMLTIVPKFSPVAQNRTCWARILPSVLLHVTASGIWSIHDLSRNGLLTMQWRGEPIYDSDVRFAVCESCFTICTSKLVNSHNQPAHWDIHVTIPGKDNVVNAGKVLSSSQQTHRPSVVKFKLEAGVQDLSIKKTSTCRKSALLFPSSTQTNSKGSCTKHRLLLQCADEIFTYKLVGTSDETNDKRHILTYHPELNYSFTSGLSTVNSLPASRNIGLSTEMVLSPNQQLVGIVYQSQLVVWERRTAQLVSHVHITLDSYIHEQMHLVSLGQMYSLIGLEFSSSLIVIVTHTGQIVREFTDFAEKHSSLVPPYIEFLGVVQDSWLSDITRPPSTSLPTVVYWNKTNRAIEGISFGEKGADPVEEGAAVNRAKSWWRLW